MRINLVYFKPIMLALLVLGFASGFPLALTASTLTAMLSDIGVNIKTIGYFGLVAMSYSYKFIWAPLVDNIQIPILHKLLGKRRSWLIAIQCLLLVSIFSISLIDIKNDFMLLAFCCLMISFFSATQDIIIDAFRVELLEPQEQAAGATMAIFGYRMGMLVSGAGALVLAHYYGWAYTYALMALLLIPGMVVGLLCRPPLAKTIRARKQGLAVWIYDTYKRPFQDFFSRKDWVAVLLLIIFYKMSDAYIGSMTNPFFMATGFTLIQIAKIIKIYGVFATFAGMFVAGLMFKRLNLYSMLYIGLVLQILSNFAYLPIYYAGVNEIVLMTGISVENFCSGLSSVVLTAYISGICNLKFTATHYAMLSSVATFTRTTLSATSGVIVEATSWPVFFLISATLSIPAFFFIKQAMRLEDAKTKA